MKKPHMFTSRFKKKETQQEATILQTPDKKASDWLRFLVIGFVIYISILFMNGCFNIVDLKAQENDVVAKTRQAQLEKEQLLNEVSYMQTDEAVEKIAREDLKMVKPGEIRLAQKQTETNEN